MPVPDGRRESCSAKTNSGNCLLAVTADFPSKQLQPFDFARWSVCQF